MDRIYLTATTDRNPVSYRVGENITFTVWAAKWCEEYTKITCERLSYKRWGDDGITEEGVWDFSDGTPLKYTTKTDIPGFVYLKVEPEGAGSDGISPVTCGAGAETDKLLPITKQSPLYDGFWSDLISDVEKCKSEPLEMILKNDYIRPGVDIYDIKLPSPYGRPISGYLSIPVGARDGTLPIRLSLAGYGVHSAGKMIDSSAIVLDMNANGIENGREPEYYKALDEGELHEYGIHDADNPYECYFKTIIARGLAALKYLRTLPQWDKKNITVQGTSQGGWQALNLAALDKSVTDCNICKPWFCDLASYRAGRCRASFRPDDSNASTECFDSAVQAAHITCRVEVMAGLGDTCCPPSGVAAMFNAIPSQNKSIVWRQNEEHGYGVPIAMDYKPM